jgi:prepilin-type N-terminal cleavage/methylation domain-containing protein
LTRPSRDAGETLIEVVIAIAIMGIAFVALMGGMLTAISLSALHRKQADTQLQLVSAVEQVKSAPYAGSCAAPPQYSVAGVSISVEYWKGQLRADVSREPRGLLPHASRSHHHGWRQPHPDHPQAGRAMPRHERDADGGFTLIELTVTVVIMTIILGALTMGVVTLLRTTGVTTDRLVGSHDAQLLTEWITTDIQSSASAPNVLTGTKPGCIDDASLPASGVNVAQMTWTDRSTGLVYHAAYRTERINAGPPAVWYLVRYFCQQGQPSTHFPVVRGLADGSVSRWVGDAAPSRTAQPWPRRPARHERGEYPDVHVHRHATAARRRRDGLDAASVPVGRRDNTDGGGMAGLINRVVVTFNEALTPYAATLSRWTPTTERRGDYRVPYLQPHRHAHLSASGSPIVTTTAGFTIDLQADPNGVRDGAGNRASFTASLSPTAWHRSSPAPPPPETGTKDGAIDQLKPHHVRTIAATQTPRSSTSGSPCRQVFTSHRRFGHHRLAEPCEHADRHGRLR